MRDFYGLMIGELGSGVFDVAPLDELLSHPLVGRVSINAEDPLNLGKQNAAQEAVLLGSGRYSIFSLSIVWHIVVFPRREARIAIRTSFWPLISRPYF